MNLENPYAAPKTPPAKVSLTPQSHRSEFALAWEIFVSNFSTITLLVAAIGVPYNLLDSYIEYFVYPLEEDFGKSFRVSSYLSAVVGVVLTAGIIGVGRDFRETGVPASFASVFWGALKAWPRMVFARLIVQVVTLLGLLLLVIPGIYYLTRAIFTEYFVVVEKESPGRAIRLSFEISKGQELKIFLYFLATTSLFVAPIVMVSIPLVMLPELDNWLSSAAFGLLLDFFATYSTLVFYCYFRKLIANQKKTVLQ